MSRVAYKDKADAQAYARQHYEANKAAYKTRAAAHKTKTIQRARAHIAECKAKPCADCGVQYPSYVMQFDHVADKVHTISDLVNQGVRFQTLVDEIAKCDVVCANCHAERTFGQR